MEGIGIIQGYETRIDPRPQGRGLVSFVRVQAGEEAQASKITEALADLLDHDIRRIPNVASTQNTIVLTTAKETREIPISDPKSTDGRPQGTSLGRAGAV